MSVGLLLLKTAAVAAAISFQSQPVAQLGAQASGSALYRCFEALNHMDKVEFRYE